MKIGIISDTHDDVENTKKAIEIFNKRGVECIIHLGDYISPPMIGLFERLKLIGILGNNDGEIFGLANAFQKIGGELKGYFAELTLDGLKIVLYHGRDKGITESLIKSGKYDVVFTGHLHKTEKTEYGKTLVINPGSAHRFFKKDPNPTVGVLNTKTKEVEFIKIK